eukprot:3267172-Prorocentrum_lima.AAC.1
MQTSGRDNLRRVPLAEHQYDEMAQSVGQLQRIAATAEFLLHLAAPAASPCRANELDKEALAAL